MLGDAMGAFRIWWRILHEEKLSFSICKIQIFNIEFTQAACYKALFPR
jgi:hypothetical protein